MNDGVFILRDLDKFTSVTDAIIAKELNLKNIVLKCGVKALVFGIDTRLFQLQAVKNLDGF